MPKKKIKVIERPLGREKALGLAWVGEDKIEIDGRLKSKQFLNVLILGGIICLFACVVVVSLIWFCKNN